jgi:hypothetical protein
LLLVLQQQFVEESVGSEVVEDWDWRVEMIASAPGMEIAVLGYSGCATTSPA